MRSAATVTPIVYTSEGAEQRLPAVHINANSAHAISIEEEMRAAGVWIDTGAVAIEYEAANPTVLNAQLTVKNASLGIIFDLPFQPGVGRTHKPSSTLMAPWWLRDPNVKGHLVLFNTSEDPVIVHPALVVAQQQKIAADMTLTGHQFREIDLRDLGSSANARLTDYGMLSISYNAPEGSIYAALLFLNEQNGYSLTTHFTAPGQHIGDGGPVYYLPGVSVNQQDPRMGFRGDLRFTPYAVLGNSTAKQLPVTLQASFDAMDGTGLQHADLPLAPLGPMETRVLDFTQYLKSGLLASNIMDFTLKLSHPGMMGDLVFQVFSVDQTGNFVFGADARMTPAFRSDFVYWSTQGNSDTMLSIHNQSDEDLPVIATISFNEGQNSYRFSPVTVDRGATVGLDLKQMIAQASKPDDMGNSIPTNANFGTLRIEPADGQPLERIMATTSIYDPVAGTCGGGCVICEGIASFALAANPLVGVLNTAQQVTATLFWDDGGTTDATLQSRFLSSTPSVISVASTPGTSGNGIATFNAVGTSTITGTFTISGEPPGEPVPICPSSCPRNFFSKPIPGTSVWVTISIRTGSGLSPSTDNSADAQYQTQLGPANSLGTFFSSGQSPNHLWRTGVEIVGTVSPSSFTGSIVLQRQVDTSCSYNGSTQSGCISAHPDTSDPSLEDIVPQSGGSMGKVYDLDAPGLGPTPTTPFNTTLRIRNNFHEWATYNGARVSNDFQWYSRISVINPSPGVILATNVPNDNTAGAGTTKTSWNLQ
jgi:hypothetical protein